MEKTFKNQDEEEESYNPPALPVGPDGGIDGELASAMIGQPAGVPARTPANFICLRGPCQHYWHLVTMAQEGNPEATWAHLGIEAPRQHHHTCLINPGAETDFGDDNAYECSKWDPVEESELVALQKRRDSYHERQKRNG